jgi:DNA-binding LytR/AlgR family response regulator
MNQWHKRGSRDTWTRYRTCNWYQYAKMPCSLRKSSDTKSLTWFSLITTAYENYALQGFELDVLDYLLKPISFERFSKAASKAADYFATRSTNAPDCFFIKVDRRLEKVFFREIVFIEALENYVAIYTALRKMVTHSTLKSVQQQLPPQFIQPHKSYLVNTAHITAVEGNQLSCGTYKIPISKYQKEEVMQKILNNNHD